MITTFNVQRANCPTCLDETLDALRRLPGVRAVHGSVDGPCIEIDHDGADSDALFASVRTHLHGVEMSANEIVMVPIEPEVAVLCAHARPTTTGGSITLADLVDRSSGAAAVLERLALDYCCGGQQTLAEAASAADLDVDTVMAQIAEEAGAADRDDEPARWTALPPAALAEHIERVHHHYLWDALPRIGALVDKIGAVHGERHPELTEVGDLYRELRAELEPHLRREEDVVFPLIAIHGTAADDLPAMLDLLAAEHDTVGDLLRRLRAVTGGYQVPADGCATYTACYRALAELESDTHLHVHEENNVLLPALRAGISRTRRGGSGHPVK